MNKLQAMMRVLLMAACGAANADIVVIVGNGNDNITISKEDLERIYLGKLATFPNGAVAYPLDNLSPEKESFYRQITGKNLIQIRAYWSKMVFSSAGQPPRAILSDSEVLSIVASNPNTIGYIDRAHLAPGVHIVFSLH